MSEKKTFVRKSTPPTVDELEQTVKKLNDTTTGKEKTASSTAYSYSIKLDEALEKRVEEATKKHRQTKKGFFLSAIEERLEKLGY